MFQFENKVIMKLYRTILLASLAVIGICSCVKESSFSKSKGSLSLTVSNDTPVSKAIIQVTDYPVEIKSGANIVKSYEKVSDIPSTVTMDVGDYTIYSHTPGTMARKMYEPFYSGSKDIKILAGTTTKADLVCTMQNTKITVKYGGDFFKVFKSWVITIDDGSDTALKFTDTDSRTDNGTSFYWYFINQVTEVNINFVGFTAENGSKISQKYTLSKSAIPTSYDNDKDYFTGGDALEFSFTPEESTSGEISSVTLIAKIEFEETEESVTVNIEDVPTFDPGEDDPGDDDPDHPTLEAIKFTLPAPITLTEGLDPALGDVKIEAENGLMSLTVKVQSNSEDMISSLEQVAQEYAGVDLITGCEVVGNQALVDFLGSLGQTITVPAIKDTEYTFPVGNFFTFLGLLSGEHNFIMTAIDMDGNTKSGTVKVTVPEM